MGHRHAFNFRRNDSCAKVTVWAALCGNGFVIGPYFFEGNVTRIAYLRMLKESALRELELHFNNQCWEGMFRDFWWIQGVAPAHRLIEVRDRLDAVFVNNHKIGFIRNTEWPPQPPDLTARDLFLWDISRTRYFLLNIAALRQNILNELNILRVDPALMVRTVRDMHQRALLCVERNGGHVEGQC